MLLKFELISSIPLTIGGGDILATIVNNVGKSLVFLKVGLMITERHSPCSNNQYTKVLRSVSTPQQLVL